MKNELSALIDNELNIDELARILNAAKSNEDVRSAWKHYHLIGDAMRGDAQMTDDFSSRVMQALESEPTVLAIKKTQHDDTESVQRKAPVFWSIAASVAAVMFVGLMVFKMQLGDAEDLSPVELAQSLPIEYLQAHQSVAPSGSSYYIQSASFTEKR